MPGRSWNHERLAVPVLEISEDGDTKSPSWDKKGYMEMDKPYLFQRNLAPAFCDGGVNPVLSESFGRGCVVPHPVCLIIPAVCLCMVRELEAGCGRKEGFQY